MVLNPESQRCLALLQEPEEGHRFSLFSSSHLSPHQESSEFVLKTSITLFYFYLFIYFLAEPCGLWDLSSPTRDLPGSESAKT